MYRTDYLCSVEWFRRRDRWFSQEQDLHEGIRCVVCQKASPPRELELHHLDYSGVQQAGDGWVAGEAHDDLVACHRRCHEWIHKLLDRDPATADTGDRRTANLQVIARLQAKIAGQLEQWGGQE